MFAHMILMDSGTGTAMCLGRTSLIGEAGSEVLNLADTGLIER
jgi:Xaa-Pro dipeptidase